MKKTILTIALAVSANLLFAQAQQTAPQRPQKLPMGEKELMAQAQKETDQLDKDLKLSPDQKKAILNINMGMDHQIDMVRTHEDNPEHLKALEHAKENQYRHVFSPEQLQKFELIQHQKMMKEQKSMQK
ncbi:MAG TPA: hypothetical protein VN721_00385 [Flavipsychrobacter sp.]|nr:hypothetical protein [Flavipsychrobacter sp.]